MKILGIESSCDETAAAVVESPSTILSSVVASQIAEHAPYGGVVPELASRAHLKAIEPVVEAAVRDAGGLAEIDAIAVTNGPGLAGALLVGVQFARALSHANQIPLIGVDHLDAHLVAAQLAEPVAYPFIALLVSGGHTALYRVDAPPHRDAATELLGQTRDDAAGEAFDKTAKLLGLAYPGGPVIDRLAAKGDRKRFPFASPMAARTTLDFSFSGLKTAVGRHVRTEGTPQDAQALADLCAGVQWAIVDVLAKKSVHACKTLGVPRLVLGGGVSANSGLRARVLELAEKAGVQVHVPPLSLCTDNAAMIAYAGLLRWQDAQEGERVEVYTRDAQRKRGKFRKDGSWVKRRADGSFATS